MEKKRYVRRNGHKKFKRWILKMKATLILMVLFALQLHAGVNAQEARLSMKFERATAKEIINEIKRNTGYSFVYSDVDVAGVVCENVDFKNATVEEILSYCLKGTGLVFTIEENTIVIHRAAPQAQQQVRGVTVRGKVVDKKGLLLPGVTVLIKGTTIGTATNNKGEFTLDIPERDSVTLVFSFVGMKTHTEVVSELKPDMAPLTITMEEEAETLDDVVVTGYGNIDKGNYTGASTNVKVNEIMMDGISSIDQMLQGQVPGMLVMNAMGQVGASSKIRVRGTSTLLGSQEPVWVVDGVVQRDPQPFNSEENTTFSMEADDIKQLAGNAISWLNPYDIESITVLKDASATAIYGSKAANGVIVITTKKAKAGKVSVNYNGSISIGQRPRYGLYDQMNSAEYMQFSKDIYDEKRTYNTQVVFIGYSELLERFNNKEITLAEMNAEYQRMAQQNTDWFDVLFRNSLNHSHSVSISGGSERIVNRTSLGFTQEKGEARGNDMILFTATSNTTVVFGEQLTVNLLLKGTMRDVNGFAYEVDPFNYAYGTTRAIPVYNEDGSLYYHGKRGTASYAIPSLDTYNYNILNELNNTGSQNITRTWGATIDLQWRLLPGLEYQGLFSYSSSSADTKQWASERSFYITQTRGYEVGSVQANSEEQRRSPLPFGGVLATDLVNTTTITVRNSLVFDRLFKERHRVTLQLGIETNSVKTKGNAATRYGYLPDRGETFTPPPATYSNGSVSMDNTAIAQGTSTVTNRLENELSEYASAIYTYDNRYVLNLSARFDASNRFSQDENNRMEPTWSAGFKWRMTEESFASGLWWLNNLDIYGSYGYQGNAVSSVSPYLIAVDGGLNQTYQSYMLNVSSLPYPDLGWEKTKSLNIGIDGSFLDGRLNFTFNYFIKNSNVLASRNVPYENGMQNAMVAGTTMKNTGYDFVIDVIPVRVGDFSWQVSLNTSVANNEVDKNQRVNVLSDYLDGSAVVAGKPYSTFYSYDFDRLNPENGKPMFNKVDAERVDSPLDFLVESGKFTPDFSGGLNTMFKYGNWTLYALFAVQWGGHDRLPELYPGASLYDNGLPKPEENVSRKLINRWKRPGDEGRTNIPSLPGLGNDNIDLPATSSEQSLRANLYEMYNLSNERVANTDFIRCRSLSLAYEMDANWLKRFYISRLQIKASMTNPFMWAFDEKWDGLDPETGDWPARRVTSLSLQVAF